MRSTMVPIHRLALAGMGLQACLFNPTGMSPSADTSESSTTEMPDDPISSASELPDAATSDTTSSESTIAGSSSTGHEFECQVHEDCDDPEAFFCVQGECQNCAASANPDVACTERDPSMPHCFEGACVQCSAGFTSPCLDYVCDEVTHECVPCTSHAECPETACNLAWGNCMDPENLIYVDRAHVCATGYGSATHPFCNISDALYRILLNYPSLGWTVKIRPGNYIEEPLVVPDDAIVAISGWEGVPKVRAMDDSGPTLTVQNDSMVFLDHLAFNSNDSNTAIICTKAQVWIDDTRLASNKDQGYMSTDCNTTVQRSVIYDNDGGGLASYGSASNTRITNSYVTGNGNQVYNDYGGLRTAQGDQMSITYSTVVNNLSANGPRSLQCVDAVSTSVRNSVLIGFGTPSVDCPTGDFSSSALDEGTIEGDDNFLATQMDIMNFFESPSAGIYPAKADTALAYLGEWTPGDPLTDFNGTPRATDAPDYVGADKP